MIRLTMSTMAVTALAVSGCGSDSEQVITGRVNSSTFPERVTHVRAIGNATTVEVAVASDGTFTIALPTYDRYRLEMRSAVRSSDLVFPRRTGEIDTTFYVASAAPPFEVGSVRYVKDPAQTTIVFDQACSEGVSAEGDVCVQDDGQDAGGAEDGSGGAEDGSGGGQDTGTGGDQDTGTGGDQDTGTGGDQDTGTGGDQDSGAECGAEASAPDGGSTSGDAAVAEANLPDALGTCDGGGEGDNGDGGEGDGGGGGQDTGAGGQDTGGGGGG